MDTFKSCAVVFLKSNSKATNCGVVGTCVPSIQSEDADETSVTFASEVTDLESLLHLLGQDRGRSNCGRRGCGAVFLDCYTPRGPLLRSTAKQSSLEKNRRSVVLAMARSRSRVTRTCLGNCGRLVPANTCPRLRRSKGSHNPVRAHKTSLPHAFLHSV